MLLELLLAAALVGAQSFHRTVIVMRHCVRSTETTFYDEPYPCVAGAIMLNLCTRKIDANKK